jgi:lipopolysaccharide export system permease protein
MLIRTLGQAARRRGGAAGRGAAAGLHRAGPPAHHAGAVAVRGRGGHPRPHVPRQRDGDLVRQRRGLGRFVRPVLRTGWPVLLVVRCCCCSSGPGATATARTCATATSSAPTCRAWRRACSRPRATAARVFFVEREARRRERAQRVHPVAARTAPANGHGRRAGRLDTTGATAGWCSSAASATRSTPERRTHAVELRYLPRAGRRARAARPTPTAQGTAHGSTCCASPTPRHQGELAWRLGMLLGAANLLLLGVGLAPPTRAAPATGTCCSRCWPSSSISTSSTSRRPGWPAASSAWAPLLLALHGLALVLALALLWWRDHAAVLRCFAPPPSPW